MTWDDHCLSIANQAALELAAILVSHLEHVFNISSSRPVRFTENPFVSET